MGRTSQTIARVTQTTEIFLKNVKNTHFNTTVTQETYTVCTKILDTYENIYFKFVRKILQQPSNNLTKI